jgi:hypothetical protein
MVLSLRSFQLSTMREECLVNNSVSTNVPHVIFIGGMDLSGSTVVDLALGSLPGIVGLGEVDNVFSPNKRSLGEQKNGPVVENICTCNNKGSECPIWGPVLSFIDAHPESSYKERYWFLLEMVKANYPDLKCVVDSSKEPQAFMRVVESLSEDPSNSHAQFTLLILRRSPLSWLISDSNRARRRGRVRNFKILNRRIRKWTSRYGSLWALKEKFPESTVGISLDDFQRNPQALKVALQKCLALESAHGNKIDIEATQSHVLWGSHHRHGSETKTAIRRQTKEPVWRNWAERVAVLMARDSSKVSRRLQSIEQTRPSR